MTILRSVVRTGLPSLFAVLAAGCPAAPVIVDLPDAPATDTPSSRRTTCASLNWSDLPNTPLFEAGVPDSTPANGLTREQALVFCNNWAAAENLPGNCGHISSMGDGPSCDTAYDACLASTAPFRCGLDDRPFEVIDCAGLTIGQVRAALARRSAALALYTANFCDVPTAQHSACQDFSSDVSPIERSAIVCALGTWLTATR